MQNAEFSMQHALRDGVLLHRGRSGRGITSFGLIRWCTALVGVLSILALGPALSGEDRRPNVVFIAIDDLNDWVGHLGGHPLVKTPHLDALAARGTTFTNAHCQAPYCNPSRTSLLTGLRPSTTGIHVLNPSLRSLPQWRKRVSLPQHFAANGYHTLGAGKIWHGGTSSGAGGEPEFRVSGPKGGPGTMPPAKLIPPTPGDNVRVVDWGVWPPGNDDSAKGDHQLATWAAEKLRAAPPERPFFLAIGFSLPHVPCFATQRWFDLYPDDDSVLPRILDGDRDDTPRFSWYLHWNLTSPRLSWVRNQGQWRNLTRSYLACTSFVDDQVGRVMTALDAAGLRDNTIVVVFSDHGWHLGEKGIIGKNSLWERSTRVPLIFAGPGITTGQRCGQPVELLDVYPTLVTLAGLPPRDDQEGLSLLPQLRNAQTRRERPALTSHYQGNHAVRSERWRYICYADGTEELYDHVADPNEWTNLSGRPEHAAVIAEHRRWLPVIDVPLAPGSGDRVLTYDRASDATTWNGKPITRSSEIP